MVITLWHLTPTKNVESIRENGFWDAPMNELPELKGVYFADRPFWEGMTDGIPDEWTGIVVVFELPDKELDSYQIKGATRQLYREWLIPADVVNRFERFYVASDVPPVG
ncbi:MAG: hypothetical protein HZA51_12120 [Planctomycetes bacterium]|nr:hypothetical protein [Planctomycetota bacterium]